MKKVVLKLDLHDDKEKQKAMKTVSAITGVDSINMDMKEKKLTVTGDIDPIYIVSKLRKFWRTEILTVGPAKEPEKKKDEGKKDDDKKKDNERLAELLKAYQSYYPPMPPPYYYAQQRVEDNPNACVIT